MKTFYNWLELKLHEVLGSVGGYPVQHALALKAANEPPRDYSRVSYFGPNYHDEHEKIKEIDKDAVIDRFGKNAWDHGFKGPDKKIIENPRNFELIMSKLEKKLAKLDFVNIHFFFGEPVDKRFAYFYTREEGYRETENYFFGHDGLNISKNDIVYIKPNTAADPLTPWLILHTFVHGMMDLTQFRDLNHKRDANDAHRLVCEFIDKILAKMVIGNPARQLQSAIDDHKKDSKYFNYYVNPDALIKDFKYSIKDYVKFSEVLYILFPKIWSFAEFHKIASNAINYKFIKSKMRLYNSLDNREITVELFVYWLQNGGKLPIIDADYKNKLKQVVDSKGFDFIDNDLEKELNNISNQFRKIIEHSRGKVIYDSRE